MASRSRKTQHVARSPHHDARAWSVVHRLHDRRAWSVDQASFQRSWPVDIPAGAFNVSAHVLLTFDDPCLVLAVTPSFPPLTTRAEVKHSIRHLQASLGKRYLVDPVEDKLVRIVRGNGPAQMLASIAELTHAFGERAAPARHSGLSGRTRRTHEDRNWSIVEALRAWSWSIGSASFSRKQGDAQWQLWARVGVFVESASGPPGINASFTGAVQETSHSWAQFRDAANVRLSAAGFRAVRSDPCFLQYQQWAAGLSVRRACKQAEMFDRLLQVGLEPVAG